MSESIDRLDSGAVEKFLCGLNQAGRFYIGYSGGIDSHVLLHLCLSLPNVKDKVTAVYVHHGLQKAADAWASHCQATATQAGVEFREIRVDARPSGRESPEEAARTARYRAFEALLDDGDVLLLAQHREDQMETVLLQLFRGAGPSGLAAMPETVALGKGALVRPLLHTAKREINDYARRHNIEWVEDPSNRCDDFDRNFLRNQVIPLLKQRWPALDATVARSAAHCADAKALIEQTAEAMLDRIFDSGDSTLSIQGLQQWDRYRQQLVLRQWFVRLGLRMPSRTFLAELMQQLVERSNNGDPFLDYQHIRLRRYRGRLYCVPKVGASSESGDRVWPDNQTLLTLPDGSHLVRMPAPDGIDAGLWRSSQVCIRFRQGGEKIALPGRNGRHTLKKLYQERGIPPWERPRVPLLYIDGRIAAVADLWISAEFYVETGSGCVRLVWQRDKKPESP
ncbi:MAG: tRNA lysidine(34) synthetase TilS [Gammaproteobacteria bacterium]